MTLAYFVVVVVSCRMRRTKTLWLAFVQLEFSFTGKEFDCIDLSGSRFSRSRTSATDSVSSFDQIKERSYIPFDHMLE